MNAKVRERKVEADLKAFVESKGALVYKWVSPGKSGVMDRIVIWPNGVVHFVEVKREGQLLNPLQALRRAEMKLNNANVFSVEGGEGLENYKGMCEKARL